MNTKETAYAEIGKLVQKFKNLSVRDRQIVHVDEEINQRVYRLYGLTEEEIGVVEGK